MSLKKMAISTIAALAIGTTLASAATPVQVENDGSGDYLIAPLYFATGNWQTNLKVVNTNPNKAIVAKVVVREATKSKEIMDFPIYLTPGDVWTGTLKESNGHVVIESNDDSMMLGFDNTGAPQFQGSVQTVTIDNGVPADPNAGSNWYGYVEIFGLAAYDPKVIDPVWASKTPLDKIAFYKYVRNHTDQSSLNKVGAEDVDNDSLIGKETILANADEDKGKRAMTLNLYALGNVAETARVYQVIGTDTTLQGNALASVSEKASAADEIDAALAKSHIYVMYEGDGKELNPIKIHFTVPTKKYHYKQNGSTLNPESEYAPNDLVGGDPSKWYYTINKTTTIFRDNKEKANYCKKDDDISGNRAQDCDIKIYDEVHQFSTNETGTSYIREYAYKEGGYIDFDLTNNTLNFRNIVGANPVHGMPIIPVTFTATNIGGFKIHNAIYNQYRVAQ